MVDKTTDNIDDKCMEWELIEGAPKDGTRVILYFPHPSGVFIGHWHQPGNPERPGFWTGEGIISKKTPTHWMPLPKFSGWPGKGET